MEGPVGRGTSAEEGPSPTRSRSFAAPRSTTPPGTATRTVRSMSGMITASPGPTTFQPRPRRKTAKNSPSRTVRIEATRKTRTIATPINEAPANISCSVAKTPPGHRNDVWGLEDQEQTPRDLEIHREDSGGT